MIVDRAHLGTPELAWQRSGLLEALPLLDVGRPRRVVVIAPHPDDEVLGAGGLLRQLVGLVADVEVLAVTDGERSHPASVVGSRSHLAAIRRRESLLALSRLCDRAPTVTRLGLPDGQVGDHVEQLAVALFDRSHQDTLWVGPWQSDGHPDHDVCGRVAAELAEERGVRSLGYFVWAWHWADPSGGDLPWEQCRRFALDHAAVDRKRWAITAFRSQIHPLGPGDPVLPPAVLTRFQRGVEVFVDTGVA